MSTKKQSNSWVETSLMDSISVKHGFAFKGEHFSDEEMSDILLTPGNFKIGGGFNGAKYKYYAGPVPEDYVLNDNDIVVTMTDLSKQGETLGYSALVPHIEGKRLLHNQRIGRVLFKPNSIITKSFLYWTMRTALYRSEVLSSATGSTVRHTSPDRILRYKFLAPPKSEQDHIVASLNSLEAKSSLNQQMNVTIEAIGHAIFKRWFVDFEFPDKNGKPYKSTGGKMVESELGLIPEGWDVERLGGLLKSIESGRRPAGGIDSSLKEGVPSIGAENVNGLGYYNYGSTKFISQEYFQQMKQGVVENNDVLLYKDGASLGRKTMFGGGFPFPTCCINEHVFILRANEYLNQVYLYFWLDQPVVTENIKNLNTNSAQPGINKESVGSLKVLVPGVHICRLFDEAVMKGIEKIFLNALEAKTLSELRDVLLPRLMNGKLRVNQ